MDAYEREAARWHRDRAAAFLAAVAADNPAECDAPVTAAYWRHQCERAGRTRAMECEEVYLSSPELWVRGEPGDLTVLTVRQARAALEAGETAEYQIVPAGRFGYYWREGRCRDCGLSARSITGRLVETARRPPLGRARELVPLAEAAAPADPQVEAPGDHQRGGEPRPQPDQRPFPPGHGGHDMTLDNSGRP